MLIAIFFEMEVDGETALKLNSSFLFAAFNNKELRLQMMECKFPMGVSNGDENQIVCVIPGTNVTVYHAYLQSSILSKWPGWEEYPREKECQIHPSVFPFRPMSDQCAFISPALYANALGKPGCPSSLRASQIEFLDNSFYVLYTGYGRENDEMTSETSKTRFDIFAGKRCFCFFATANYLKSLTWMLRQESLMFGICFATLLWR
jgi:hypothetical protein